MPRYSTFSPPLFRPCYNAGPFKPTKSLMNEYLDFASRHLLLIGSAVLLLILIVVHELRNASRGGRSVGPLAAVPMMNRGAQLIDLRSTDAYQRGHILNARSIPSAELADQLGKLDRNKPVLLYCDTGISSQRSANVLKQAGFNEVWSLQGGYAAWLRENLPVVKG